MKKIYLFLTAALASGIFSVSADNTPQNPIPVFFEEGFDNASFTNEGWTVIPVEGETATVAPSHYDEYTGLTPYLDRDKGMLVITNDKAGKFYLMSPYIKMQDSPESELGMCFYMSPGIKGEGYLEVDGVMNADSSNNLWESSPMSQEWTSASTNGWPNYGSYEGNVLRFGWLITTNGEGGSICLDELWLGERDAYDFALLHEHATPVVRRGETMNLSVDASVLGRLTSMNFTITATIDGETKLDPFKPTTNPFSYNYAHALYTYEVPADMAYGEHKVDFELKFTGDWASKTEPNTENNFATATFRVVPEYLPAAVDLRENEGLLTWRSPADGNRFTDDIESMPSFADGDMDVVYELDPVYDYDSLVTVYNTHGVIGGYEVIDGDRKTTVSDENWAAKPVDNVFHLMACTVGDFTIPAEGLAAASGNKALVFWSNTDASPCDNYLVLPELNPSDRKLSFKARCFDGDYPEKIELMSSSTGTAADNFTAFKTLDVTSTDFADFEAEIPADAKYVAIRQTSDEGYALTIDDIAYSMKAREIKGYNVYRDGVKVNSELLATPSYTLGEPGKYAVTVVYAEGESDLSGVIDTNPTAIGTITAGSDEAPVYYNLQGIRVANPDKGIYIEIRGGKSRKIAF